MHRFLIICTSILRKYRETGILPPEAMGGYLTILSKKRPAPALLVAQVEEVSNPLKVFKYHMLSQEKASRLWPEASYADGHISSHQSRDPDSGKYGGSIVAGDYILSFSGLPELADQALMLALAVAAELLTYQEAVKIARISGDKTYFRALSTHLKMS